MTGIIRRLLGRITHRDGDDAGESPSLSLCFYDTLHDQWIRLPYGQHVAIMAVTGGGKSNLVSDMLVNLEPEVDDGLVQIYGVDLKGGVEFNRFGGYMTSLATSLDEAIRLLEELNRLMDERGQALLAAHRSSVTIGPGTPGIVLVIDEAAELTGAVDKQTKQRQEQARGLLDRMLRLGRALGFTVVMASQDPRKESLALRDRCPTRIALRLNSIEETRMALGDSAIQAGCAPWLIGARHPGTGFLYDADRNTAIRFRCQHVPDKAIEALREAHPRIAAPHDGPHPDTTTGDEADTPPTA